MPRDRAWFCLRSQQKHEHLAARQLALIEEVEVFNPRIRFLRSTRHGPVWITESLFPNYLFARFDWKQCLARVHYAPGVKHIVHFGVKWPTVPDEDIAELQASLGAEEVHVIPRDLEPGESVQISGGMFHGLQAVVTRVMTGSERVGVLMDFLGRQTMVEVSLHTVVRENARAYK